jgi:hypothetical protein
MVTQRMTAALATSAMLALAPTITVAVDPGSGDGALAMFDRRIAEYVELHHRVAGAFPPPGVSDDPDDINCAIDALGGALRAARPDAKAGDIFTPAAAALIRARVTDALDTNADETAMLLREMGAGHYRPAIINERFPRGVSRMMWPVILWVLPPLPPELEYRFVGGDLVLLDVDADLVVDVLDAVLPEPPSDFLVAAASGVQPGAFASRRARRLLR